MQEEIFIRINFKTSTKSLSYLAVHQVFQPLPDSWRRRLCLGDVTNPQKLGWNSNTLRGGGLVTAAGVSTEHGKWCARSYALASCFLFFSSSIWGWGGTKTAGVSEISASSEATAASPLKLLRRVRRCLIFRIPCLHCCPMWCYVVWYVERHSPFYVSVSMFLCFQARDQLG